METVLSTIWLTVLWVAVSATLVDFGIVKLCEKEYEFGVSLMFGQWAALLLVGIILSAALTI